MKNTVKALKEISSKLDRMRNGSIYYGNKPEDDCLRSINDIAEKIFAAKIDLDMNECDTVKLWDKCIEKAIIIYFNYSLVKNNWDDFWKKERENNCAMDITSYKNKDKKINGTDYEHTNMEKRIKSITLKFHTDVNEIDIAEEIKNLIRKLSRDYNIRSDVSAEYI